MRSFKQHINEAAIPVPKNEKQVRDLIGNILFGEIRNKKEQDKTPTETSMAKALMNFIIDPTVSNKKRIAELHKVFKAIEKYEPEYVKPPNGYLYRKTVMKEKNLVPIVRDYDISGKKGDYVFYNSVHLYKAKHEVQSWTNDFNVAEEFEGEALNSDDMIIILATDPPQKDLLFNPKLTNLFSKKQFGHHENEVIRVSKKPIKCTVYINRDDKLFLEDEYINYDDD